jgi:trimeric autotransporter adhesin
MISRSIDQLTCQCRPFRCCQAYSGDQGHHDKPSHPAARYDCLDGDAARDLLRIACADRTACRGASQGRGWPPGRQEGGAEGCPAAGCRAEGAGCSTSSTTSGRGTSASSGTSAAAACCGSAAASSAAPATSGGSTTAAPDTAAASTGCCTEGAASAAPGGCTFAPDAATTSSAGSRACGAEATGRTDYSASAAAFISEGDAITCAAAASPGWRQAAAGACHHASSTSTADGRPAAWRKHDDGATAASRRTDAASECGCSDDRADNRTTGTTRRAASGYAGRSCGTGSDPCADDEPRAECWHPRRSGRNTASGRSHGSGRHRACSTDRRAGRAERHATGRPGTERPTDRRAGLPPGASGHRAAASRPATESRRAQSHCPGCATVRTATP